MPDQTRICSPGPDARTVRAADGSLLTVPAGWVRVPPGDPGLTRRVKAGGPTWTGQGGEGRKTVSPRGGAGRAGRAAGRAPPAFARRKAADAARRDREQAGYVEDFRGAVLAFLAFAPAYGGLASRVADAVTAHATP